MRQVRDYKHSLVANNHTLATTKKGILEMGNRITGAVSFIQDVEYTDYMKINEQRSFRVIEQGIPEALMNSTFQYKSRSCVERIFKTRNRYSDSDLTPYSERQLPEVYS